MRLVGDRADGLSADAILGIVAKQVYIIQKVILFLLHSLHHRYGSDDIVNGPVRVDHLPRKAVCIDGIAQLVGEIVAIPEDRQQIQLILAL